LSETGSGTADGAGADPGPAAASAAPVGSGGTPPSPPDRSAGGTTEGATPAGSTGGAAGDGGAEQGKNAKKGEQGESAEQGEQGKENGQGEQDEQGGGEGAPETVPQDGIRFGQTQNMVAEGTKADNLWQAGRMTVHYVDQRAKEKEVILRADATRLAEAEAHLFVSPPGFADLLEALSGEALVLVSGTGGSGRRSAALQALRKSGYEQLIQLPADSDTRQLVAEVRSDSEDVGAGEGGARPVGFLVEAVSLQLIRALASFAIHELRAEVKVGKVGVVLVADALEVAAAPHLPDVPVVTLEHPDPLSVLERRLAETGREEDAHDLRAVLAALPQPLAPQRVIEVARTVDCRPPFDPAEAAGRFSSASSYDALDVWLADGRPAEDVAMLASAATLHQRPVGDVYVGARDLAAMIDPESYEPDDASPRLIRRVSQQWPQEMIELSTRQVATEFGRQPQQSIGFCKGHRAHWTLEFLWDRLGADFRIPFVDWLVGLAERQLEVESAAIAAGVLFTTDPVTVEGHILRRWARAEEVWCNVAAGWSLGIPALTGSNGAGARALAKQWSDSGERHQIRAAIFAYGGPLGAWDDTSSGPVHLVRIGHDHPDLCRWADSGLADLVAADGDAVRVRFTVFALLQNMTADYRQARRAYGILALIAQRLCTDAPDARESLASLMSDREQGSREAWVGLLAQALLAAPGHDAAHRAIALLAIAASEGTISEDVVVALFREMKRVSSDLERLGTQLRRSLTALKHNNTGRAADAPQAAKDRERQLIDLTDRLLDTFFGRRTFDDRS
jgi:hypothetical protein